jgi:hypothetical protein
VLYSFTLSEEAIKPKYTGVQSRSPVSSGQISTPRLSRSCTVVHRFYQISGQLWHAPPLPTATFLVSAHMGQAWAGATATDCRTPRYCPTTPTLSKASMPTVLVRLNPHLQPPSTCHITDRIPIPRFTAYSL